MPEHKDFILFGWIFTQDLSRGGGNCSQCRNLHVVKGLVSQPTEPVESHEWPQAALTLSLRLSMWSFAKWQKCCWAAGPPPPLRLCVCPLPRDSRMPGTPPASCRRVRMVREGGCALPQGGCCRFWVVLVGNLPHSCYKCN